VTEMQYFAAVQHRVHELPIADLYRCCKGKCYPK